MMNLPTIYGDYKFNYNLAHLTWFKVGGPADILFKPKDIEDLISFLKQNNDQMPITIFGAGSNLLIRDKGIEGVLVKLGRGFTDISTDNKDNLCVGAACLNINLAKFCQINAIKDFEFLVGIPGTAGGGIVTNAGAYGSEFKDIVVAVEAIDKFGKLHILSSEEIGFTYRNNNLPKDFLFTKVIFKKNSGDSEVILKRMKEINELRAKTQPIYAKTAGSTFANPVGDYKVWELVNAAGLKGKKIGDAGISELHSNFLINHGAATAADIEELGELIRLEVKKHTGIDLEWELRRIGRK